MDRLSSSEEPSSANPQPRATQSKQKLQRWMKYVPFTRPWREKKKARKGKADKGRTASDNSGERLEDLEESDSEIKVVAATRPRINGWKKRWTKSATPTTKLGPRRGKKSLAQYPHHDEKGAVGRTPPMPAHTPYPYNERVGGARVLAQQAHHDDKWAVKRPLH